MRGFTITLDFVFSVFIFIGIVYYLSAMWNSRVQELATQQEDLLHLRTEQTLTYVFKQMGGHRLDTFRIQALISEFNHNYTEAKNSIGLEDADVKLLLRDFNGTVLYQTNTTPAGSLLVTATRYGYIDQPVRLDAWVWQ